MLHKSLRHGDFTFCPWNALKLAWDQKSINMFQMAVVIILIKLAIVIVLVKLAIVIVLIKLAVGLVLIKLAIVIFFIKLAIVIVFYQISHSYSFDMNAIVLFSMQVFWVWSGAMTTFQTWIFGPLPSFVCFSIMYLIVNVDGDLIDGRIPNSLCFYDRMYIEFTEQVLGLWKLLLLPSQNGRLLSLID